MRWRQRENPSPIIIVIIIVVASNGAAVLKEGEICEGPRHPEELHGDSPLLLQTGAAVRQVLIHLYPRSANQVPRRGDHFISLLLAVGLRVIRVAAAVVVVVAAVVCVAHNDLLQRQLHGSFGRPPLLFLSLSRDEVALRHDDREQHAHHQGHTHNHAHGHSYSEHDFSLGGAVCVCRSGGEVVCCVGRGVRVLWRCAVAH